MKLEDICNQLSREVIIFLKEWIKVCEETEASFHKYRMRLLDMSSKEGNDVSSKLIAVCKKSGARVHFDIKEVISDKLIGESTASYIFAKLIQSLNHEYMDILEREMDIVKNENERMKDKINNMSVRLGVH
jgi:gas vesicle protein